MGGRLSTTTATTTAFSTTSPISGSLVAASTTSIAATLFTTAFSTTSFTFTRFLFTGSAGSSSLLSRVSIRASNLFSALPTYDFSNGLAATCRFFFRRAQFAQGLQAGMDGVRLIRASKRLGQDIAHARRFHHGTYCSTGDNSCTRSRRFEHNFGGAKARSHHERNGRPGKRHLHQVLLGVFHALTNGFRILAGFAKTAADIAVAITNNHESPDTKAPSTLDLLGDAAYLNYRFFQI